jgi:ssDNA-binding replication factor A large subunit
MKINEIQEKQPVKQLSAVVITVANPRKVRTKTGEEVYLTEAVIADDTGAINLTLWDSKVLLQEGDRILLSNGWAYKYKDRLQIGLGKYGKIKKEVGNPRA